MCNHFISVSKPQVTTSAQNKLRRRNLCSLEFTKPNQVTPSRQIKKKKKTRKNYPPEKAQQLSWEEQGVLEAVSSRSTSPLPLQAETGQISRVGLEKLVAPHPPELF